MLERVQIPNFFPHFRCKKQFNTSEWKYSNISSEFCCMLLRFCWEINVKGFCMHIRLENLLLTIWWVCLLRRCTETNFSLWTGSFFLSRSSMALHSVRIWSFWLQMGFGNFIDILKRLLLTSKMLDRSFYDKWSLGYYILKLR